MKNTKFNVLLIVLIALSCVLLSGCKIIDHMESNKPSESDIATTCDHKKLTWIVEKEATGFEEGLKSRVCESCGETMEQKALPRVESQGLAYKVNEDGRTCTVTGIGSCTDKDVRIPKQIDGYRVVTIRNSAFNPRDGESKIERLYVPGTVKNIEAYAFKDNEHLREIYLEDGIETIGVGAFEHCFALESVRLPADLEVIENGLFSYCKSLREIVVPDSVKVISDSAFYRCYGLKKAVIPGSVDRIEILAFSDCTSLESVELGDGIKIIGSAAFDNCPALNDIVLPDSIEFIGGRAFAECKGLKEVVLPAGIKVVKNGLFIGCSSLESVTVPEGVVSIGDHAFEDCSALVKLVIPTTIMNVGYEAFSGCSTLHYNTYGGASYLGSKDNPYAVLVRVDNKELTSLDIYPETRAICTGAFENCTQLENITLPFGFIGLEGDSLLRCESIKYNEYKNGKYLGSVENPYFMLVAFNNNTTDREIEIHADTKVIGDSAFIQCANMTSVKIPDGVISIGDSAFSGQRYLAAVEIPNSVRYIGAHAFSGCEKITSVIVPGGVEFIGESAFSHCTALKKVVIFDGITTVENWFSSSPVKSITIPASVKMVEELPIEGLGEGKRLEEVVYGGTKEGWYDVYTSWDRLNMYMEYLRLNIVCSNGDLKIGGGWANPQ